MPNKKIEWVKLINSPISLETQTKVINPKGRLVYEYNPFRNLRLSENKYLYKGNFYSYEELKKKFNLIYKYYYAESDKYFSYEELYEEGILPDPIDPKTDSNGIQYYEGFIFVNTPKPYDKKKIFWDTDEEIELYEKGQLVDFITDNLHFSLEHPVQIIPQPSYDGSVNLIINDGINIPRLINSRFSPTGKNTYEIIDRKGTNDTNIYDEGELFDTDTSLYKRVSKIPKIKYLGNTSSGNLKVGSYYFYFKLADVDGNESDFIGESGLVSVFIGFDTPSSIHSGNKNQNSYKAVKFFLSNLDESYDYVKVYYSRTTAENGLNAFTEYKRIEKKYAINNAGACNLLITGFDTEVDITINDLNLHYNIVDSVKSSAVCQNMLFMANVHKPDINYKELEDLSLRFLPCLYEETYDLSLTENYGVTTNSLGYYDPKYIYEKVGYWEEELYRFGIVYILPNNELTPVFNIRGGINITKNPTFTSFGLFDGNQRNYITYNELNYYIIPPKDSESNVSFENVKGVVSFSAEKDTDTIYGIKISTTVDVINELKKYVKGYFFVRQTRIPTILAQGITIGVDLTSFTPCIPTKEGVLTDLLTEATKKTHIDTDLNAINYISEGFISRYKYYFKRKSSSLWGKIGLVAAIAVAVVAVAAVCVVTAGAGAAALTAAATASTAAASAAGVTAATATALTAAAASFTSAAAALSTVAAGSLITGAAITGAAAVVGTTVAAAIQQASFNQRSSARYNGRNTPTPSGHKKVEEDSSRILTQDFLERVIMKEQSKVKVQAILCPDYLVNLSLYNQIFTGNEHTVSLTRSQGIREGYFDNKDRHFYMPAYSDKLQNKSYYSFKIKGVGDNIKLVNLDDLKFRSRAGQAEEAWKYECVGDDYKSDYSKANDEEDEETITNKQINSDIIRGCFEPYLAFNNTNKINAAETINIYIPDYSKNDLENYIKIRINDSSAYNAISDRYDLNDLVKPSILVGNTNTSEIVELIVFRGDCYLCQFTHRLNRNFNDPSAPYNDEIVNEKSWKDNYNTTSTEKQADINLGDVNAIQLGMWVTFKIRSSNNLNIRTLDGSNVDESEMTGHDKGFYPYHSMSVEGTFKHPSSQIYNKGFAKSVGDRWNVVVPDVPHIKNWYGTRIMYSDIHINDAFKNGFRIFQGLNYRDYTREYGEITKIVAFESSLLCVFEHGIALIPVNERALAGKGSGGNIYVQTASVLPENPKIISDSYGSQWADSILKVPGVNSQVVYGVDTIAKKIWVTDGNSINCISDGKVLEFLNNNITLGERELTPKLGIRNVKTVYNAFKKDVMFTFYDDTYGHDEKVWNLCYNESLLKFITFYSWVPSFMENINNIPFSFNRVVSKYLAKLGTSLEGNSFSDGIVLDNIYCDKYKDTVFADDYIKVGKLSLVNRILPDNLDYEIKYELLNHKDIFKIENDILYCKKSALTFDKGGLYSEFYYRNSERHSYADDDKNKTFNVSASNYMQLPIFKNLTGKRITRKYLNKNNPEESQINPDNVVMLLDIKAKISIITNSNTNYSQDYYNQLAGYESETTLVDAGYYESTVAVTTEWNMQFLSTDFWKHGLAGIFDISDDIYPTYWYGKQHPFEFEMLVTNDPSVHKIFSNLEIIANKAKPESFHYEIVGESYDFAKDKINMFIKQEALKAIWLYNDTPISYDRNYLKCQPTYLIKSADFIKKYYYRHDSFNEVEDYYLSNISESEKEGKNFNHLAGAEIVYYPNRQEYRIWNHAPAVDLNDQLQEDARSIIAANCQYKEDKWIVNINPIILCYKNEYLVNNESQSDFKLKLPLLNSLLPDTIIKKCEENKDLLVPSELSKFDLDFNDWGERKEIDLKDKFIKVRIRYSGEELVVINALNTLYRESYG